MARIRRSTFADQHEQWRHTFGPDAANCQKGSVRYASVAVRAMVDEENYFLANDEPGQIPPPIETEPSQL
jgi:hypothetical protein